MTNLYVSPDGSDSNTGSQNSPFATIAAASAVATPGTTIYVAPGTYFGGFTTSASGTSSAPITYVSETQYGAVISGGGDIGWTNTGSNVIIKGFDITGPTDRIGLYETGGSNDVVEGNEVHDILSDSSSSVYQNAISTQDGGAGILMDNWGSGGYGTGGENGSITGNLVYNIGPSNKTDSLVQGIYMVQSGTVANNVIYNVSSSGITDWHGADHINIVNNTIDDARDNGIVLGADPGTGTADDLNVGNNIITNSGDGIEEEGSTGSHNTYFNNLVYNDGSNPISLQNGLSATNTVTANPMFVNEAAHDYQLQAGSPAIGAGSPNLAPTTDFAGNPRPQGAAVDIGAYQHGTGGQPPPPAPDTLTLRVSEDAWKGNAQFTVSVDGMQVGGTLTASALHSSGDANVFVLSGAWGSGAHHVQITFINDAYGGSPAMDRNLYVNSIGYDGVTYSNTTAALMGNGARDFTVGGATAAGTAPADTLTVHLAEDAYNGNAEFTLSIDGKTITTAQPVTALHSAGAWQDFTFAGNLGAGTHAIGVTFTNDAYGGSPSLERNLYINGIDVNGTHYGNGVTALMTNGTASYTITTQH